MKNSEVIKQVRYIYSLGQKEALNKFALYLKTNGFKEEDEIFALYNYLRRHRNQDDLLDKSIIYKKVFGKDDFDGRKLRNRSYELSKKLKKFATADILTQKEHLKNIILLEFPLKLNKRDRYIKAVNKIMADFKPDRSAEWHLTKSKLYRNIYYDFPKDDQLSPSTYEQFLKTALLEHEKYDAITRLENYGELLLRNKWYGSKLTKNFEAKLKFYSEQFSAQENNSIYITLLLNTNHLLLELTLENYKIVKSSFEENFDELSSRDKSLILNFLINSLHLNSNLSNNLSCEVFSLYKLGVKHGLFVINNRMEEIDFENIVYFSIELKEYSWCQKFLATHKSFVKEDYYSKINVLSNAYVLYNKNKFKEALVKLESIKLKSLSFSIRIYLLKMKCLYKDNDFCGIDTISERFRHYLLRQEHIGQELLIRLKNFTSLVKKMTKYQHNKRYTKEYLKQNYQKYNGEIMERKWLNQMIDDL